MLTWRHRLPTRIRLQFHYNTRTHFTHMEIKSTFGTHELIQYTDIHKYTHTQLHLRFTKKLTLAQIHVLHFTTCMISFCVCSWNETNLSITTIYPSLCRVYWFLFFPLWYVNSPRKWINHIKQFRLIKIRIQRYK